MSRTFPTNGLVREVLGPQHPIPLGWQVIVETYNFGDSFLDKGEETVFDRPDSSKDRDKYQISIGRILLMGDAAFRGDKFKDWLLLPRAGDYVSFQKYEGVYKTFNGKDLQYLQDYLILDIIPDPKLSNYIHFVGN
jgi:co-chaperonin GroES (HSP10)